MDRIYADIDALSGSRDLRELVARLQRILGGIAYYVSQSEGVVLDHREGWRESYARALATNSAPCVVRPFGRGGGRDGPGAPAAGTPGPPTPGPSYAPGGGAAYRRGDRRPRRKKSRPRRKKSRSR